MALKRETKDNSTLYTVCLPTLPAYLCIYTKKILLKTPHYDNYQKNPTKKEKNSVVTLTSNI